MATCPTCMQSGIAVYLHGGEYLLRFHTLAGVECDGVDGPPQALGVNDASADIVKAYNAGEYSHFGDDIRDRDGRTL